jgi:hypothetical protein
LEINYLDIIVSREKKFFCLFLEKKRSSSAQAAAAAAADQHSIQQELYKLDLKFSNKFWGGCDQLVECNASFLIWYRSSSSMLMQERKKLQDNLRNTARLCKNRNGSLLLQ